MALVYKQLFRQLAKGRVFLILLFLLTALTSLSFFFVMFSVDGNMAVLYSMQKLNENQQLYKNALSANTTLAYTFLAFLTGLTCAVLVMFFYRFFRANRKQIGCIKSLGFRNGALRNCFVAFMGILSAAGTVAGCAGGYFLSGVLINANTETYSVTGLVKGIGIPSLSAGILLSAIIYCMVSFACYGFVSRKEPGALLSGNNGQERYSAVLKIADTVSRIAPADRRLTLRIALRKPLSIVLLIIAVMSFNVFLVLGRSLNISSAEVFKAQTIGHNYGYDTHFAEFQTVKEPEHTVKYIESPATLLTDGGIELERTMTGLYKMNDVFELENKDGRLLGAPEAGTVYAGAELSEIYGVNVGDTLMAAIAGETLELTVTDIAVNAKSAVVYVNGEEMAEILRLTPGAYNGVLSMDEIPGGKSTTKDQRIDNLERNAVSNNISGVINQVSGGLVGAIMIFLALYVNFQDNTRDMMILHMMGYRNRGIRKMLVDVYRPILWAAFAVTLAPSIYLAKAVQKGLSISTNDYMPFKTNVLVVLIAFALLHLIYWGVQSMFQFHIRRTVSKEEVSELVYAE